MSARPRQPGPDVSSFGRRLKKIRDEKRLSQTELAVKASLTPAAVSQIEADDRQPSFKTLSSLAGALNVSVGYLLGEEPDLPPHLQAFFRDLEKLDANDVAKLKDFAAFLREKAKKPEA